ncbi:hypothetical protein T265_08616 [Opisthorchis viverrini]|uniref:Reverse transcriptase domain-containing protein n=1 Tax=Opisthorchis viverrini TaxID=6198 RepID=A0A074ZCX4_OPIVI|nr:hypothetical protein T265_08616 [Opisthorchis viverrini]KER23492.1 hypothetical protein T265_08616 [Opisthorchis viverrini]
MRRTLDGFQNPGVQIVAGESLVDLEYEDDIALIFEDHSEALVRLNKLTTIIPSFGMRLAPSKYKVMFQKVQSSNVSLNIQEESLEVVENFTYLGSPTSLSYPRLSNANPPVINTTKDDSRISVASEDANDTLLLGMEHILNIVEDITTISKEYVTNMMLTDRSLARKSGSQIHNSNEGEYVSFPCHLTCYLRPPIGTREFERIHTVASASAEFQPTVMDCSPKSERPTSTTEEISVSVTCISHYTGSLIHVVIRTIKTVRESSPSPVTILSDQVAFQIANQILNRSQRVDLYVTLDFQLLFLGPSELRDIKSWLRYLAIDGNNIISIDKTLLRELQLDHFVIEGCRRVERVDPIGLHNYEAGLSSSSNCVVVWRYLCPKMTEFIIWADERTQNNLCPAHLDNNREGSTVRPSISRQRRAKRTILSPRHRNFKEDQQTAVMSQSDVYKHWSLLAQRLIEKLDSGSICSNKDVRQDMLWYQNILTLSIITIFILSTLLGVGCICALTIFRLQLRTSVKPIRATL